MADQDKLTTITLPFARGVDTRTQLEALDATAGFTVAENVRFTKRGALAKRHGFADMATTPAPNPAVHLFPWKETSPTLVDSDDGATYAVNFGHRSSTRRRRTLGRVSEVTAKRYAIAGIRSDYSDPAGFVGQVVNDTDCCKLGPYLLSSVSYDKNGSQIVDLVVSDGTNVVDTQSLSVPTYQNGRLVSVADVAGVPTAILLYQGTTGSAQVRGRQVSLDANENIVVGVETAIFSTTANNNFQWWDVCAHDGGIFVAVLSASGPGFTALAFTNALTATGTVWIEAIGNLTSLTVASFGTGVSAKRFVYVHSTSLGHRLYHRDAANATTTVAMSGLHLQAPDALVMVATGIADCVCWANIGTKEGLSFRMVVQSLAIAATGNLPGIAAMSRFMVRSGIVYGVMQTAPVDPLSPSQAAYDPIAVLAEVWRPNATRLLGAVRPLASVAPRLISVRDFRVTGLVYDGSRYARAIIPVGKSQVSASMQVAEFDFASSVRQSAPLADVQYFGGGLVEKFDGVSVHEAAFLYRPMLFTSSVGAGGALTGTYLYTAIYEFVDAQGNLEQSAPMQVASFTGTTVTNTLNIQPLGLTQRGLGTGSQVRLVLYRTTNGGSTFYRLQAKSGVATAVVSFVDNLVDASLVTGANARPLLYKGLGSPGDFVDHAAPPSLSPVGLHQSRLVGASDDATTVWISNRAVDGEGVYWSEAFALPISEGGPITGFASQDGVLYVFKRSAIFACSGDGPTENGQGSYTVQRLPSDVGCINPRSIVITPDGAWFQSVRGLELLARGGSLAPWDQLGASVAAYLNDDITITSSVTDASKSIALWTCQTSDGFGYTIVYDYANRAWTRDAVAYLTTPGAGAGAPAVSSAMVLSATTGALQYTRLQSDGHVLVESNDYRDVSTVDNGWITATLETGWVRMAGIIGEHNIPNIYLLSHIEGPHGLEFLSTYDYRPFGATPMRSYTSTELAALAAGKDSYRCDLVTSEQRGPAVRVRFRDLPPVGWGAGLTGGNSASFIGLVFEGQVKSTHSRGPAGER